MRTTILICLCFTPLTVVAEKIRSHVAHGYYDCTISDEELAKTPRWSDITKEPPLSLVDAVKSATSKLKRLQEDNADDWPRFRVEWRMAKVELKQGATSDHWFYVVLFRSNLKPKPPIKLDRGRASSGWGNPYETSRELKIPVLMNGKTPKMVEHRHSAQILSLLDDLSL